VNAVIFIPVLLVASTLAGLIGSLTGLGGGIVIVPLLVLGFGVDVRYAIGASLIAVIATSSGAAAAFVRDGYTNIRVGMLLEVATTAGALAGAAIAIYMPAAGISLLFGAVLLYTAVATFIRSKPVSLSMDPDLLATRLQLNGDYPTEKGVKAPYYPRRTIPAFCVMFGAGVLSALAGIGSGIVKVLAMDKLMGLPFKVSTATSNFMIGVTASASAGVYFYRGQIEPRSAAPVAVGALAGAFLGARLLPKINVAMLRRGFSCVVCVVGVQMIYRGVAGLFGSTA